MAPEKQFPPIRACLFDMDGLLLNTEDLYTECINAVLSRHGRPNLPWSIKAKLQGRPGPEANKLFMDWAKLDLSHEEFLSEISAEQRKIFPGADVLPGVTELLGSLGRTRYWDLKRQKDWNAPGGPGAKAKNSKGQPYRRTTVGCWSGPQSVTDPDLPVEEVKFQTGLTQVYMTPQEKELNDYYEKKLAANLATLDGGSRPASRDRSIKDQDPFEFMEELNKTMETYPLGKSPPLSSLPSGPGHPGAPLLFKSSPLHMSPPTSRPTSRPLEESNPIAPTSSHANSMKTHPAGSIRDDHSEGMTLTTTADNATSLSEGVKGTIPPDSDPTRNLPPLQGFYPKRRWLPNLRSPEEKDEMERRRDELRRMTEEAQQWIRLAKKWEADFAQHNGRRVHIALATSSHEVNFHLKTKHLSEVFSVFPNHRRVLGDDKRLEAGRGKPLPDIFLLALRTINDSLPDDEPRIKPEECLVFEDSVPGVEAGRRAGMRVVWVPHEGLKKEYNERMDQVLAGTIGEAGLDLKAPGEVGDGWAEYLPSLENFPYDKYGIRVPPPEVEKEVGMVESDPKVLAKTETDETRLAESVGKTMTMICEDLQQRIAEDSTQGPALTPQQREAAEAKKIKEWWESMSETARAQERLRYFDMVIEDIEADRDRNDKKIQELEKRRKWFNWNIDEAVKMRKDVEASISTPAPGMEGTHSTLVARTAKDGVDARDEKGVSS